MDKLLRILAAAFAATLVAAFAAKAPAEAEPGTNEKAAPRAEVEADPRPSLCATIDIHSRYLSGRFGEFPVFAGTVSPGLSMQLFANRATGSWTMLLVNDNGLSCVQGAGSDGRHQVGL
jgi:hypothetical protein